jgi:geranylgeranyl diphosphate synthase type II
MGAIAGGAGPSQMEALSIYGECLGTAFQISDDILDLTGDEKTLGKAARKDAGRGKLVHPAVFGLEGSRKKAEGLVQEAQNALRDLGNGAEPLKALAEFVVSRNN